MGFKNGFNDDEKLDLYRVKWLLNVVQDKSIKVFVRENAFQELWQLLRPSVTKVVGKTFSKYKLNALMHKDTFDDAILDSLTSLIGNNLRSWDPRKKTAPATYAYKLIVQITTNLIGVMSTSLDHVDEDGNTMIKASVEKALAEKEYAIAPTCNGLDSFSHPFDSLHALDNPIVDTLLDALRYLEEMGIISADQATLVADRITGTPYSIIAEYFGIAEVTARKRAHRVRQEMRKLVLELPRYKELLELQFMQERSEKRNDNREFGQSA